MAARIFYTACHGRSAPWRGRLSCRADGGLRLPLAPAVGGPLEAPSTYPPYAGAPQYAARGIGALSPVQPVPVRPAPSFDNRAVPLDPTPCDLRPAEPGQDSAVQPPLARPRKTAPRSPAWAPRCPAMAAVTPRPAAPLGCGQEAPPEPPPEYALDLESADIPAAR